MIALPKAISQGSNATGGGALAAFIEISAARADPAVTANIAAANTIFFMTIPITVRTNSPISVSQGQATIDCVKLRLQSGALLPLAGKQKARASADFLGVFGVWRNVVGWCCITTTFFDRSKRFCDRSPAPVERLSGRPRRSSPGPASFQVNPANFSESSGWTAGVSAHEKGRSDGRGGLSRLRGNAEFPLSVVISAGRRRLMTARMSP